MVRHGTTRHLKHRAPEHIEVERCRADEVAQRRSVTSELAARWSDGGKKAAPRWLWHAMAHQSGTVLAYVFGRRQEAVVLQLKALLAPLGLTRFCPAGWGAYQRPLTPAQQTVGKQPRQTSARKPSHLRTWIQRLVRRTSCFSKTTTRHDLVIGLVSNRYELGVSL